MISTEGLPRHSRSWFASDLPHWSLVQPRTHRSWNSLLKSLSAHSMRTLTTHRIASLIVVVSLAMLGRVAPLRAQTSGDSTAFDELFPTGNGESDPLGTGDTASLRDVADAPERIVWPDVEQGAVLAAIPGVREIDHDVEIALEDGLATIRTTLRLIHRGRFPAEVTYRLAVPADAVAGTVQALRDGVPAEDVHASAERVDGAFLLAVRPVESRSTTTLHFVYTTEAQVRGGVARVDLPARGHDGRIAPARVHAEVDGLLAGSLQDEPIDSALIVESWRPIVVQGRLPTGGSPQVSVQRFECGDTLCARVHVAAGAARARRERYLLLMDVSPSTQGPMRGRMSPTIEALAAVAHPDSTLQAVAFAARSESLDSEPLAPAQWVASRHVARAQILELGPATRLEAALATLRPRRGDHVLILGDGSLSAGPRTPAALAQLEASGARVSVLNVGDAPSRDELRELATATGGVDLEISAHGNLADERLQEWVSRVVMPTAARRVLGTPIRMLRSGDGETWMGEVSRRAVFAAGRTRVRMPRRTNEELADRNALLAARMSPPPRVEFGRTERDDIVSVPRALAANTPPSRRGLTERAALSMFRSRLIPAARRCLRADRRGRANYSVRAVYDLVLEEREIASASVQGEIPDALRACLEQTVDELDVPPFDGRIRIRYPIRTEAVVAQPAIEILGEVDSTLESVVGNEPTRPSAE